MSANESFDIDLVKAEKRQLLTEEDEDNLDEFVGQLQDAFHFAKQELPEELVYIAIEKTFKEYFKGVDLKIKSTGTEKIRKLKVGA